ncbi:MAG: hypothetical protein IKD75_03215 [Prevotella sp.]|nr:hypothetical protein [Prevotella sp.]
MKSCQKVLVLILLMVCNTMYGQVNNNKSGRWIKVSEDEDVTISYNSNIVTGQNGNHFVWVKAVYHTPEWQNYFSQMIGSRVSVVTTRTKAEYDEIYSYVRVRQVICYSKDGKKLFDTGDDRSAGWGYVNASDPVGIVGEYLGK